MSWSKLAVKKPLSSKQTQPRLVHKDIICLHTMVGYLTSTKTMFDKDGYTGTESHVGVGGIWGGDKSPGLDGVAWQFQDTDYTADANYEGSWHILSIEVADNAPNLPSQIVAMTPKQIDKIVDLICEWCVEYDIPPTLIPDTKPGRRGLAYHYQGVGPNLVKGGELWSKAGHECPGPVRIKQFKEEIIPRVQARLSGKDDDMNWGDKIPLTNGDAAAWNLSSVRVPATATSKAIPWKAGDLVTYSDMVRYPTLARKTDATVNSLATTVKAQGTQITALLAAVQALAANSPEAIQKAFADGEAALAKQLADLKIVVSLDDDNA